MSVNYAPTSILINGITGVRRPRRTVGLERSFVDTPLTTRSLPGRVDDGEFDLVNAFQRPNPRQ